MALAKMRPSVAQQMARAGSDIGGDRGMIGGTGPAGGVRQGEFGAGRGHEHDREREAGR